MIRLIFFLLAGFSFTSLPAQSFPAAWQGKWTGDLEIWNPTGKVNEVPMSLEIQPTDSAWTFIITYNAGTEEPDIREYSLITIDSAAGHYAIDEHNSILLDAYLLDNCLYDRFAVMGSDLFSRICLDGEVLEYEIISGQTEPVRISGDTIMGTDTIPAVNSYRLFNVIKAALRRE